MYSKDTGKDQMLMTMERALTSGQKAGFFFLGFLGGIVGILAASLMNINAPYRPEGTKMAALGFATACVLLWMLRRDPLRRGRTRLVDCRDCRSVVV